MKNFIFVILCIQILWGVEWVTDIHVALKKAQEENKYVLAYFADEMQCGMCKTFKENILLHDTFIHETKNYILCALDPVSSREEKTLLAYKNLFEKFQINEIPTIMFFNPNGKVFFRSVYNGEIYKEYMSILTRVVDIQNFYTETLNDFTQKNNYFSIDETNYVCQEIAKHIEACPPQATILVTKLAQLLFYLDKDNHTGKKAKAAYLFCLYAHNVDKVPYLTYLKNDSLKNNSVYYAQLLDEYFRDQTQSLAAIYKAVHEEGISQKKEDLIQNAQQILAELQGYSLDIESEQTGLDILITYLFCYCSLSDTKNADVVWKRLEKEYSSDVKIKYLKELLQKN